MKKVIIFAVFFTAWAGLFADGYNAGGQLMFSFYNDEIQNISIAPSFEFGALDSDEFFIGIRARFNYNPNDSSGYTYTDFLIMPYMRPVLRIGDIGLFLMGGLFYMYQHYDGYGDYHYIGVGIYPGLEFYVEDSFSVYFTIGNFDAYFVFRDSWFDSRINLNLAVGSVGFRIPF